MHNGLLKMGHAKMAGSVGNVVNIADLLQKHHPETVRFLLLATHYRSPIEYSDERLVEVGKALQSFYRFFERYRRITGESFYALKPEPGGSATGDFGALRSRFLDCMNDDFNTGGATGVLFELLSALNRHADANKLEAGGDSAAKDEFRRGAAVLCELSSILGLFWAPVTSPTAGGDTLVEPLRQLVTELGGAPAGDVDGLMQELIRLRADARKAKNFAVADQIRKRLGELKVTLEDRPGGKTDWRVGS
jgi:cysteinyl-tRNA synthetase